MTANKVSTPRKKQLVIAGQRIARGRTYDLEIAYSENFAGEEMCVPLRVIAAPKPGPVVFLTALVHGDELNGLGIIRELIYDRELMLDCGTLVAVPVVNLTGLENHSRYLPDRRDLNRSFPGSAKGSMSARLADAIFRGVISKCDYGMDFHTAAVRRTNYPNIRADLNDANVAGLAEAFGCELIVHNKGAEGSLRRIASAAGIPTIVLEAGEVWKIEPAIMEIGVRGVLNVLAHLGMISARILKPPYQLNIRRSVWVRAERGGILNFHVRPGGFVRKGDPLATNLGIRGRHKRTVLRAPADGIVLGMTTMPAVKPGEPVVHLALPARSLDSCIKRMASQDPGSLHRRLRKDLATNIRISKPGTPGDTALPYRFS